MKDGAIRHFFREERGITSVEYALLLAFVGAAAAAGMFLLAGAVAGRLDTATTDLDG